MAVAIAEAINHGESLIVEAGTGTGKTLAYLVPALLSGQRIVVSTGTKALQDQLFDRDLPAARDALGVGLRVSRLKGRSNYLCLHRMEQAMADGRQAPAVIRSLQTVRAWAGRTADGDIAELGSIPERSPVWPLVTSTTDNCLGSRCPRYSDCWVVEARRKAQEADVVVVNHHLLFADMALKDSGFGEVLPGADVLVIDEAHQAPETAAGFFGSALTHRQLFELIADSKRELGLAGGGDTALLEQLDQLDTAVHGLERALPAQRGRHAWEAAIEQDARSRDAREALQAALEDVQGGLKQAASRSEGLGHCEARARAACDVLEALGKEDVTQHVRWVERFARGFALRATPLSVADRIERARERLPASWIFTSATLAVAGDFSHYQNRMGLAATPTHNFESPFDYAAQSRLLLPNLPEPNDPQFRSQFVNLCERLIEASDGGAFVLCTSHAALRAVADVLDARIEQQVLIQGSAPKHLLLEAFRADGDAVLVGTHSFWEGVDVPGRALRLVIIDRLPFASPGDPVIQARSNALRSQGMDPFMHDQLPQAVMTLKQGAGRLIRGQNDCGLLAVCDARVQTRRYGKRFLDSLPPMSQIRDVDEAETFLRDISA
ncbi:ATP-dependent DNA helicase [bacterium]|nr:ATP-dependent DNA helicase [bacterium]